MFDERELAGLTDQLSDYILTSQHHRDGQDKLVGNFQQLITDYRQLRSDYEEEKESREKYKQLARGQERDPFVLVLVDGDSYIFRDQYIKAGTSGGVSAAQALNNGIKEMLHSRMSPGEADLCRVMVRIYANLAGLSKALAKAGLVGQEARSLAPFTSSFTRAGELCDFVDAGDKKDAADFKVREMFRLFADNSQCKHIFFAGCHDVGYLSVLTPYRGKSDRVTLLKAGSFHSEFSSLDLPVRELRTCFRSTPLPGIVSTSPPKALGATPGVKKFCAYYPKGCCKYGDSCLNEHAHNLANLENPENSEKQERFEKLEKSEKPEKRLAGLKLLDKYPTLSLRSTSGILATSKPSNVLPKTRPVDASIQGKIIPVNKNGDRLEIFLEKPSLEAWKAYNLRKEQHKVCNSYHLSGRCEIGPDCELDHRELSPLALTTLQHILKKNPCIVGSACRHPTCYVGHVCQIDDCQGGSSCRFKPDRHIQNFDFKVAKWVEPEVAPAPSTAATVPPSTVPSAAVSPVADAPPAIVPATVEPGVDNSPDAIILLENVPGVPCPANIHGPVRCILDEDMIDIQSF